jgi:hypothetical protein
MTRTSDVERVLREYLADDRLAAPDYVLDVIEQRISRQPQRRSWRLLRRPFMNTYAKLVAAAAAVLVVGFVGWQLLPGSGDVGAGPTPKPTASPTAPATASPSVTINPTTVTLRPIVGNPFGWQVTVPLGWSIGGNWYLYPASLGGPAGNAGTGQPNGLAVAFVNAPQVYVDSCDVGSMSDTSSVAELVAAIQAKPDWVVSTPVDVALSGFQGQRLDATLPSDLSVCGPDANYLVFGERGTENGFYAQGPSQQLRLWVLDLNGRVVLLALESFAATPATALSQGQQIIESSALMP